MKRIFKSILASAGLVFAALIGGGALAQTDQVKVHGVSPWNDVQEGINSKLSSKQRKALRDKNLEVLFVAGQLQNGYCFADVGLVSPQKSDYSVRYPNRMVSHLRTYGSESDATACLNQVAIDALAAFTAEQFDVILAAGAKVEIASIEKMPPNPKLVTLYAFDFEKKSSKQPLFDLLFNHGFNKAFDYREVQAVVDTETYEMTGGATFCKAMAWISAVNPNSVNPRFNSARVHAGLATKEATESVEDCKIRAAKAALNSLLNEGAWDSKGLLKDFKLVREVGVPMPDVAKAKKAREEVLADNKAQPAKTVSTTQSTKVLRCHNNCVNGMCTRTFEDGRKEKWQAPRAFNPLTGNWDWDTTTNACGG